MIHLLEPFVSWPQRLWQCGRFGLYKAPATGCYLQNPIDPLMSWFKNMSHRPHGQNTTSSHIPTDNAAPPEWTPAPERPHVYGLYNEATDDEYESAERFCRQYPIEPPRLLSSDIVERIDAEGCKLWALESPRSPRFVGRVEIAGEKRGGLTRVITEKRCGDVCLMSNLPILAGLYEIQGKSGIYYEVCIRRMEGIIAIGEYSRS